MNSPPRPSLFHAHYCCRFCHDEAFNDACNARNMRRVTRDMCCAGTAATNSSTCAAGAKSFSVCPMTRDKCCQQLRATCAHVHMWRVPCVKRKACKLFAAVRCLRLIAVCSSSSLLVHQISSPEQTRRTCISSLDNATKARAQQHFCKKSSKISPNT